MKLSKSGDLLGYFNGFFRGIQQSEREQEMKSAFILVEEFNLYVDALARANPHKFHHVYEWNSVGDSGARLFSLRVLPAGNSALIQYEFLPSVTPNDNGHVFTNKAEMMESGDMVTFETDKNVPIGDEEFRTGSFTFKPGGVHTTGSFGRTFAEFFIARRNIMINTRGGTVKPSQFSDSGGYRDGRGFYDRIRIK
jgi:hypothetical protein